MDHIWGAAETWRERLPAIEMSVFQEELIARGLKEHADEADAMPASVQFPLMYTVRADLKPDHLVTKRCPLLPWNSGVAAGVLVGPD